MILRRLSSRDHLPERRSSAIDARTLNAAAAILGDITTRGDRAVLEHAERFGDIRDGWPILYTREDLAAARDRLPVHERETLYRVADRIRSFALAQRGCLTDLSIRVAGGEAGHTCIPVKSAGCYAPGGRFPLPSSVLMTAVTARAAGVETVFVASPRPTDATLAAASIAGADGLLAMGGVQAIAALARGLLGTPRCDMIVGPGNRYVTAAKLLLSSEVGIDMLAGPSELAIIADDSADPRLVAADLLAQAEHDDDAIPVLISLSDPLVEAVECELARQLESLPTASTARSALRNGFSVIAPTLRDAVAISDAFGPEHLEIHARNPERVAAMVRNAGSLFIGSRSSEVFGDYGAGPNHVLPTGGSSRSRAGLSVFTFLRARTWLRMESTALVADSAALARLESLEGHAITAELRLSIAPSEEPAQ